MSRMNFSFDLPLDGLQRELAADALKRGGAPFDPADHAAFHDGVRRVWGYYRALSFRARPKGLQRLSHLVDRELFWRNTEEFLDDVEFPAKRRSRIVNDLNRFNRVIRTYDWFYQALASFVRDLPDGDLRVLDVGSGHGAFPIYLSRKGEVAGRRVDVTGSDINPDFVAQAQARALAEKVRADFRVLDATRLADDPERYDVIVSSQTIHHFSPGFLAELMAHLRAHARLGVVLFDDRRALWAAVAGALGTAVIGRDPYFVHDAVVSVRRMYSPAELELLARCAPDGDAYRARNFGPHYTLTTAKT